MRYGSMYYSLPLAYLSFGPATRYFAMAWLLLLSVLCIVFELMTSDFAQGLSIRTFYLFILIVYVILSIANMFQFLQETTTGLIGDCAAWLKAQVQPGTQSESAPRHPARSQTPAVPALR